MAGNRLKREVCCGYVIQTEIKSFILIYYFGSTVAVTVWSCVNQSLLGVQEQYG